MANFTLTILSCGAAFGDDSDSAACEVARILRDIAARLERGGIGPQSEGRIYDVNGNRVGGYIARW